MKAIPKRLLCHWAEAIKYGSPDLWGKSAEEVIAHLKYVRLIREVKMVYDKQNNQVQQAALLYFDCVNSQPAEFDFSSADRIRHNGVDYKIINIKPIIAFDKTHHIEVSLSI
ncbi:MAG: putative minor capsid protein [Ruminiclostridium sp.]